MSFRFLTFLPREAEGAEGTEYGFGIGDQSVITINGWHDTNNVRYWNLIIILIPQF